MNYETVALKTNRLLLKKGTKEDFLKVYEYDFSHLKNIDGENKLVNQDSNKICDLFKNGNYYNKAKKAHVLDWIIYRDDNAIGNVLTNELDDKKSVNLEFNLHPSYWNKGYMIESLSSVIDYLFSLGYDSVLCTYLECNKRVKNLLGKLGFKPYMIIKDSFKSVKGNMIDEYEVMIKKDDWFSKTGRLIKINGSL